MSVPKYQNQILAGLSVADRAMLTPHLSSVELLVKDVIERPNAAIEHVYFPESGVISIVARSSTDQMEAGLIGREGASGAAVILGNHQSPNDAFVQVEGSAYRIAAKQFRNALDSSKPLRQRMQRFALAFTIQVSRTAFANGKAQIDVRLARWLLMIHDRNDSNELMLTHESIAVTLGVRRSSVTEALQELEGSGLIRSSRGVIRITSRKRLVSRAGEFYGIPESEYDRLLGRG